MFKLLAIGFTIILCTASVAAQALPSGKAGQLYLQGRALTKQQRFAEAVPILKQANLTDPRSFDIHYELGWTFEHLNQADKALPEYKTALELCPKQNTQMMSDTLQGLASTCSKLGNQADAIALLERAATLEPDSETIHYNLGIKYQKSGNNQKAIEKFQRALQLEPKKTNALLAMSDSYLDLGKNKEAIDLAKRATTIQPDSGSAHFTLAYAYRHSGDPQKAREEFQQVLRIKPDDFGAMRAVGNCYLDQGKKKEAVDWYAAYLKANPKAQDYKETYDLIAQLLTDIKKQPILEDPNGPDYVMSAIGTSPRRWTPEKMPLKIFIEPGKNVVGMRDSNVRILKESFNEWMAASQGRLAFKLVPSAELADIVCSWTSNPADLTDSGTDYNTGISLITEVNRGERGIEIEKVHMKIMTVEKEGQTSPVDENKIRGTCLHEIGHTLGLRHSPNSKDIMYFKEPPFVLIQTSNRDKTTLFRFYEDYPTLTEKSGVR